MPHRESCLRSLRFAILFGQLFSFVSTFAPVLLSPSGLLRQCGTISQHAYRVSQIPRSKRFVAKAGTGLQAEIPEKSGKSGFRAWIKRKSSRIFGGEDYGGDAQPDGAVPTGAPFQVRGTIDELKDYVRTFEKYAYDGADGSDSGGGLLFKFSCGLPMSFFVASDPAVVRHILLEEAPRYSRGILSDILEPFMGQSLLVAPYEVWKDRRRTLGSGFNRRFLDDMASIFADSALALCERLDAAAVSGEVIDLELEWNRCALDNVGKAVFDTDWEGTADGGVSPVVASTKGLLDQVEHRTRSVVPYWKIPFVGGEWSVPSFLPEQRKFSSDIKVVIGALDRLIENQVQRMKTEERDGKDADATLGHVSVLRFMLEQKGADLTHRELRYDLLALLIAGHDSVGSTMTWLTWLLALHPSEKDKIYQEICSLPNPLPSPDDFVLLPQLRNAISETLRLFPQPPMLLRRALERDVLPRAAGKDGNVQKAAVKVKRGRDFFISVWNLHRSPLFWTDPVRFIPDRWNHATPAHLVEKYNENRSPDEPSWKGYTPEPNALHPNEINTDFTFLPFGAGPRKCLGYRFAFFQMVGDPWPNERSVCLSYILNCQAILSSIVFRRFDFELIGNHDPTSPFDSDVGAQSGSTFHTKNGLKVLVKRKT